MDGIIYFLGWVFVVILILIFLLLFVSYILAKIYCPKCGKSIDRNNVSYGGNAQFSCSRCDTTIYCKDIFSENHLPQSIPFRIWNIKRFVASFIFWKRWVSSANKNA